MVLDEIQTAIDHREYSKAIEMASTASMQGNYDEAETDAQTIISLEPTISLGYQSLGDVYQIQGKQERAIRAYELGLERVSADEPKYDLMLESKETAAKQNRIGVDFIAKLPVEIVDEIIGFLPQDYKFVCLQVSETWKAKLLTCRRAWRTATVNRIADKAQLMAVIDDIAACVEELTINIDDKQVLNTCLLSMKHGNFVNITTLSLMPTAMGLIDVSLVMPMANAFHQTSTTLTKLVLHHNKGHTPMVLADLLVIFVNLKSLIYITTNRFKDIVGKFPLPRPHNALMDLELYAVHIANDYIIQGLLRHCPELKRLAIVNRCNKRHYYPEQEENDIFHIVDRACKKLKIFKYNIDGREPPRSLRVPDTSGQDLPGLQEVYVMKCVDLQPLFELLRRNTATLKIANLTLCPERPMLITAVMPEYIKLERLEKLAFSHISPRFASLAYQWISKCDTLLHLEISSLYDATRLANALISRSRLASLSFSHFYGRSIASQLARLFRSYAADFQTSGTFEDITLVNCGINDSVLDGLSGIRTLKSITLTSLKGISTTSFTSFFNNLPECTTTISLSWMESITDQHLGAIGRLRSVEAVHLKSLNTVTDDGVYAMVNRAPLLYSLAVIYCKGVSEKAISHARRKVRFVTTY
ncbi:hypothetical protein BJV82DRAFT_607111 [Fennellomyces sp. T-0311]|nr:hypothetical protein BJV82DRAFT_607111 [Fennellomyces sp. T-0311]